MSHFFFNQCASNTSGFSIPETIWDYHYPRSGRGMTAILAYSDATYPVPYMREYLQGRLFKALTFGKSYCVTFYVSLSQSAVYATNHIAAYFDDGTIDSGNNNANCVFDFSYLTPQVIEDGIIIDTLGWDISIAIAPSVNPYASDSAIYDRRWVKVQGSFIATGTEKFITIGNFDDNSHIDTVRIQAGGGAASYLIDDVSVVESDAVADAGSDTVIHPGDSVWIGNDTAAVGGGDGMPCWWYKKGSTTSFDSGGRIQVHPDTTTTYIMMMDLCGNITYDTVTVNVWKLGIPTSPSGSEVVVYPLPAQNLVYIKGFNTTATYKLCNMIGTTILQGTLTNNSIDMSKLASGVYVLTLTPQHTPDPSQEGNVVVRIIIKQ